MSLQDIEEWLSQAKLVLSRYSLSPEDQLNLYPDFVDKAYELGDETSPLVLTLPNASLRMRRDVAVAVEAICKIDKLVTDRDDALDTHFWSEDGVRESKYWEEARQIAREALAALG